jgi:hypothetical protein
MSLESPFSRGFAAANERDSWCCRASLPRQAGIIRPQRQASVFLAISNERVPMPACQERVGKDQVPDSGAQQGRTGSSLAPTRLDRGGLTLEAEQEKACGLQFSLATRRRARTARRCPRPAASARRHTHMRAVRERSSTSMMQNKTLAVSAVRNKMDCCYRFFCS